MEGHKVCICIYAHSKIDVHYIYQYYDKRKDSCAIHNLHNKNIELMSI